MRTSQRASSRSEEHGRGVNCWMLISFVHPSCAAIVICEMAKVKYNGKEINSVLHCSN
jgi:hypothetical protein